MAFLVRPLRIRASRKNMNFVHSIIPLALLGLLLPASAPSQNPEPSRPVLKTSAEILSENPGAQQRLLGAYSNIPGMPLTARQVKLYVFDGTDIVCIAELAAKSKEAMKCWRESEAPASIRKTVEDEGARYREKLKLQEFQRAGFEK